MTLQCVVEFWERRILSFIPSTWEPSHAWTMWEFVEGFYTITILLLQKEEKNERRREKSWMRQFQHQKKWRGWWHDGWPGGIKKKRAAMWCDCVFFPFFFVASSCFLLLLASFPITEEPVHIYPRCEVHIPLVFRWILAGTSSVCACVCLFEFIFQEASHKKESDDWAAAGWRQFNACQKNSFYNHRITQPTIISIFYC